MKLLYEGYCYNLRIELAKIETFRVLQRSLMAGKKLCVISWYVCRIYYDANCINRTFDNFIKFFMPPLYTYDVWYPETNQNYAKINALFYHIYSLRKGFMQYWIWCAWILCFVGFKTQGNNANLCSVLHFHIRLFSLLI